MKLIKDKTLYILLICKRIRTLNIEEQKKSLRKSAVGRRRDPQGGTLVCLWPVVVASQDQKVRDDAGRWAGVTSSKALGEEMRIKNFKYI